MYVMRMRNRVLETKSVGREGRGVAMETDLALDLTAAARWCWSPASASSPRRLLVSMYLTVGAACLLAGVVTHKIIAAAAMSALQLTALAVGPLTAYAVDLFPTSLRLMMTVKGAIEKGNLPKGEVISATLDEAMMLTGFGTYNILHMLLNGVILMGVIMQNLAMGYILPAAQCDLGLTLQQQGLLAAIPFFATILMSYWWGYLGDTRGRKPVMLYTMLLTCVFSVLASLAPNLVSFAVLEFISAIFMSGSTAIVYTYTGEFNNLRHRDKMVAFGSSFVGIGTVVLPALAWLILPLNFAYPIAFLGIDYRPWRLLMVACALPYAVGSLFLLISPESPKFLNVIGKHDECLEVLKKIYAVNKRQKGDRFPVKSLIADHPPTKEDENKQRSLLLSLLVSMKNQTIPLFKMPLLPWTALTFFVQFGLFATTNGFYVWIPTILNSLANHQGGDSRICNVLESQKVLVINGTVVECDDSMSTSTFERSIYIGLVFSSMYIVVGFLVDFIGKKIILVTTLTITGLCGIGSHLAGNQQLAVILFALFQMCGACIGLMNAVAVDLFPTKFRAMAVCLSMMMGRVGSMIGSNILGLLLHTHCGVSFYLFGGIIILNGLVCVMLPGKQKKKEDKTSNVESTQYQTHEPE